MRIRSTKPEFWRSERIASVSWDARLVLKGLESYVDDNGVGKYDLALILSDVFPRDLAKELREPSRNTPGLFQKVSEAISDLSRAGLLWLYEVDGTPLLYIAFWESIQRIEKPSKGRFRRPDGTMDYRESEIRQPLPEPSRNPPGTLRPGTGEQGNRGTEEKEGSNVALVEGGPGGDPQNLPVARKRAPTMTGTRLPEDWEPSQAVKVDLAAQYPTIRLGAVLDEFRNYWLAIPGQRGRKCDWDRTFRNRVAEVADKPRYQLNGHQISTVDQKALGWLARKTEVQGIEQ